MARWSSLPDDVLSIVFEDLAVEDVIKLTQLSKVDASRIYSLALPSLLRRTACHHVTVDPRDRARLTPQDPKDEQVDVVQMTKTIRHNRKIEENFRNRRFLARQVGNTWFKPCRPSIELESDRLLIATGPTLTIHGLSADGFHKTGHDSRKGVVSIDQVPVPLVRARTRNSSQIRQEGFGRFAQRAAVASPLDDLTGVVSLGNNNYVVSTVGGKLQRISLRENAGSNGARLQAVSTALYPHTANVPIESLTSSRHTDQDQHKQKFLTASHDGLVSLYDATSPWSAPATFNIGSRPWSSLLSLEGSQPYVVIGSSGLTSLRVYPIGEGAAFDAGHRHGKSPTPPTKTLHGAQVKSAVYDIASPNGDMANPFSNNPTSILLSAWFDGRARIHDLRVSGTGALSCGSENGEGGGGKTRPVMEMFDPWLQSSLYSCAWTGPGNIATGSSRHGMVSLFDTRMLMQSRHSMPASRDTHTTYNSNQPLLEDPRSSNVDMLQWHRGGYSMYSPGRPESPVYRLHGEGGRLWGVTDRRAFVFAFDVEGDRPNLADSRGWDVVSDACRAGPAPWTRRSGNRSGNRNEAAEDLKDYAAGYAMDDRQLRLFDSLRIDD